MLKCIKRLFKKKQFIAPYHYAVAEGEIGQKELNGSLHNPRIIEYHSFTSLKATTDEVPWCASFINWCLAKANVNHTGSARARSYLEWGYEVDEPRKGDIVVFWRGSPYSQSGHVAFYVERISSGWVKVLGGNQSNKVCYQNYPSDRVISYRRSF